ncbi:uroporphyrinogen-III synthase [Vibrio sp. JC009]|uniref:uroporphyrinogen-III synthase n=1 Tax=Vibrio sp. JC009 TaxID=2912314 RepID=UPI0023B13D9A|nr:uroporphyrinogen-III synthase [Vibrio sp. JC009]WED21768.1 uroporphyrinogen-III synthase [Vibrio sp. JC009]
MSTVLVTRPDPDGEALCCQLKEAGISAISHPLIVFRAGISIDELFDRINAADIVIAVSKPSVEWADTALKSQSHSWPDKPIYLAVGQKTADKLSKCVQQTVHYPIVSDSENLLELPQLQNVAGKSVLILRGNGGRELIRSQLSAKGATVHYCEVYQRQAVTFDGHSKAEEWKRRGVDHIVVTSAEQLSILTNSIPATRHHWLFAQLLMVPSARIAAMASDLGFCNVKATGSASNPDLLATIQSLLKIGHTDDK